MMPQAMVTEYAFKGSARKGNAARYNAPTKVNTWIPLKVNTQNTRVDIQAVLNIKILGGTDPRIVELKAAIPNQTSAKPLEP